MAFCVKSLAAALLAATALVGAACSSADNVGGTAGNGSAGQLSSPSPVGGSGLSGAGATPPPAMGGVGGSGSGSGSVAGSAGGAGVVGTGSMAGMEISSGGQAGVGPELDASVPDSSYGTDASVAVDTGAPSSMATPSAGCASAAGRPPGGAVSVAQSHYLAFPESYDGTRPFPVLMGFHGCGSVNRGTNIGDTEWMRLTQGSGFATDYVRVVPVSADAGGCWSYDTDIGRVKAIYDGLLTDYCVDTSRVFATGHSSGAQFIVQIATDRHTADAQHLGFKGLAPVAASDYGAIAGPVAVMYIQGMMDRERGNGDGHETVERFRTANSCGATSMPYSGVAGCQSSGTTVNPGCIAYEGCDAPTVWCSHNDPAYSGTMHGVPCFGVPAIYDFFASLM